MSEAHEVRAPVGEIEAKAVEWIERRHFGPWSPEDEESLEVWLSQSLHHRVAFDRLDLGWQRTTRLTALRQPHTPSGAPPSARRIRWRAIGTALSVIVLAAVAAGLFLLPADKQLTYATSVGGREVVRLIDGSQIELNTDTKIRVLERANNREVWLDRGEAYFQILHDGARPLTVNAGDERITDLGTKFLLHRDGDHLKIAVSEGGVRLEPSRDLSRQKAIVLRPGDIAIATSFGVSVKKEPESTLTNTLAWRTGVLVFHHSRLADVAAEFNRYNHKQIVIADPAVANFEIGGTFPTTDVDGFAAVTRDVLRLHVQTDSGAVWISR
jgi:transmembrane sensor